MFVRTLCSAVLACWGRCSGFYSFLPVHTIIAYCSSRRWAFVWRLVWRHVMMSQHWRLSFCFSNVKNSAESKVFGRIHRRKTHSHYNSRQLKACTGSSLRSRTLIDHWLIIDQWPVFLRWKLPAVSWGITVVMRETSAGHQCWGHMDVTESTHRRLL